MSHEDVTTDEVRLAVPARPEYIRLVRLTATALATRLEFGYDQVEDLRIAVDELCYLLVGPVGREGSITVTFSPDGAGLVIRGHGPSGGGPAQFPELSEQILDAIVDDYAVAEDADGSVTFHMATRRR